jgi:hypothetical protein
MGEALQVSKTLDVLTGGKKGQKPKHRGLRIGISILLVSLIISLGAAELVVRSVFSRITATDRFLMWSEPLFRLESSGAIHYKENDRIREAAVFFGQVEYDIQFPTNNLGFVDTENYPAPGNATGKRRDIVVLGDSFSTGAGGGAWLHQLRDSLRARMPELNLYNLAFCGAGIQHFQKNLVHYAPLLRPTELLIIAISNDFHRLYWSPLQNEHEIRMCPEGESEEICKKRFPFASITTRDGDASALLAEAHARRMAQTAWFQNQYAEITFPLNVLVQYSQVAEMAYRYTNKEPLFALAEHQQELGQSIKDFAEKKNIEALTSIRTQFPDLPITFLHLPERGEVIRKQYDIDLHDTIEKLSIKYVPALQQCDWGESDFLPHDTHPNQNGYKRVARCLEMLLFSK